MSAQSYQKLYEKWRQERLARQHCAEKRRATLITNGLAVFRKFGIQKVVLFGSVAAKQSRATSDIDLLVMPLTAEIYWVFRRELEQALEYPVDLYTQDDDQRFVNKILQRGEIIYEA